MTHALDGRLGARVVDIHIHAVPPALVDRITAGDFPGVELREENAGPRFLFPDMAASPPGPPNLFDFPGLAQRGEEAGIDVQIVGPWTDLLGYSLPRPQAAAWARAYNEALAGACAEHEGLIPMATIPMQFPDDAAEEMEAARAMGCRGVMVGTDIPPNGIDDPGLDRVWDAATGLEMPLLIHPTFTQIPVRLLSRGLKNTVGRAAEGILCLTQFIYAGILDRHTDLKVIAALGGCGLVPMRERIIRNHTLGWSQSDADVEVSMRRIYFDSIVLDPGFLRYLIHEVGADRVMLGSDYPFLWEPDPVGFVTAAEMDPEDTAAVLGGTAADVFGLS